MPRTSKYTVPTRTVRVPGYALQQVEHLSHLLDQGGIIQAQALIPNGSGQTKQINLLYSQQGVEILAELDVPVPRSASEDIAVETEYQDRNEYGDDAAETYFSPTEVDLINNGSCHWSTPVVIQIDGDENEKPFIDVIENTSSLITTSLAAITVIEGTDSYCGPCLTWMLVEAEDKTEVEAGRERTSPEGLEVADSNCSDSIPAEELHEQGETELVTGDDSPATEGKDGERQAVINCAELCNSASLEKLGEFGNFCGLTEMDSSNRLNARSVTIQSTLEPIVTIPAEASAPTEDIEPELFDEVESAATVEVDEAELRQFVVRLFEVWKRLSREVWGEVVTIEAIYNQGFQSMLAMSFLAQLGAVHDRGVNTVWGRLILTQRQQDGDLLKVGKGTANGVTFTKIIRAKHLNSPSAPIPQWGEEHSAATELGQPTVPALIEDLHGQEVDGSAIVTEPVDAPEPLSEPQVEPDPESVSSTVPDFLQRLRQRHQGKV